ncbi:hypothetical protein WME94_52285 [Sorangium sp. So ce429]
MSTDHRSPNGTKPSTVERPRYYPRQLITADDLTLEQDYVRDKLRRHNRMLHGWGVVAGAKLAVPNKPKPWMILVKSGYILGPYGDEIWIERDVCLDVRTRCFSAEFSEDPCDPCADDPSQQDLPEGTLHIAVRYQELKSRPVRVQPVGCGCDDSPCEYSRWRDGYEICVLDDCPESHTETPPDFFPGGREADLPDLPPLPSDPWVVLGTVDVDAQGNVSNPRHCDCRRQVRSFAHFWWRCNGEATDERKPVEPAPVTPVSE